MDEDYRDFDPSKADAKADMISIKRSPECMTRVLKSSKHVICPLHIVSADKVPP